MQEVKSPRFKATISEVFGLFTELLKVRSVLCLRIFSFAAVASVLIALLMARQGEGFEPDETSLADLLSFIAVNMLLGLVLGAFYAASYYPMREMILRRLEPDTSLVQILSLYLSRLLAVFVFYIIMGLAIMLGMVFLIIPGILLSYFLTSGPYLVSARRETLRAAISTSFLWGVQHWRLILAAWIVSILTGGISVLIPPILGSVFNLTFWAEGLWAQIATLPFIFLAWLYWCATFIVIDFSEER